MFEALRLSSDDDRREVYYESGSGIRHREERFANLDNLDPKLLSELSLCGIEQGLVRLELPAGKLP